eukprot:2506401-Rhodomonas_salina.1
MNGLVGPPCAGSGPGIAHHIPRQSAARTQKLAANDVLDARSRLPLLRSFGCPLVENSPCLQRGS